MNEQFKALNFDIPHMASIKKTAELFGLPVHFVRQKVTSGEIFAVKAGNRYLVNVERLAEYLNTNKIHPEEQDEQGGITPIPVKLR